MGFRQFLHVVAACPAAGPHHLDCLSRNSLRRSRETCARTCRSGEKYPGVEALNVAVMGCIVNGPGESSMPISAFRFPAPVKRLPPRLHRRPEGDDAARANIAAEFEGLVADYIEKRFGKKTEAADKGTGCSALS